MGITLWEYVDGELDGGLEKQLREWHTKEGIGTPTIATRLQDMGFDIEQRTVWRWLKAKQIARKRATK